MKARRRRPRGPERPLPAGLTRASLVPNRPHADHDVITEWITFIRAERPEADLIDLLLASDGLTVGDVLDDPTGFSTLLDD
ncbi:MAG: hypothetical protein ACJ72E_09615 [Marmoricola sp.]